MHKLVIHLQNRGMFSKTEHRHSWKITDVFFPRKNETILFGGMLKQSHIQFVTNTIVCSLVLNNYSIYKFSKALVHQKNTNESPFETDKTPFILPSFLQKLWHWFSRLVLQEESQSLTQIISDATSFISIM